MSELIDIFRKDPLDCSKQDIQAVVGAMRDRRAQFNLGNMSAGKVNVKETPKVAEANKAANLADLDL